MMPRGTSTPLVMLAAIFGGLAVAALALGHWPPALAAALVLAVIVAATKDNDPTK